MKTHMTRDMSSMMTKHVQQVRFKRCVFVFNTEVSSLQDCLWVGSYCLGSILQEGQITPSSSENVVTRCSDHLWKLKCKRNIFGTIHATDLKQTSSFMNISTY